MLLCPAGVPAAAADYDLVILNGRVMDPETGLDAVRNVGVKDGKIATITAAAIQGRQTIDARDHVVAPGFIDVHSHGQDAFAFKLKLRDGVTTAMEIEAGAYSAGHSGLRDLAGGRALSGAKSPLRGG
jgi:N-acyl-D-aspartate/D-glutamate deacylase